MRGGGKVPQDYLLPVSNPGRQDLTYARATVISPATSMVPIFTDLPVSSF